MTLMLLDAASLYFRAFYGVKAAMPAPDGTPTNAVRGFLDMVSTLITRFRPTDMVACLDEDWRPAWRVALLPSYKTHRLAEPGAGLTAGGGGAPPGQAEPPGLAEQVPIILDALAALGIAALGAPEHEADDVLATLAARATMPVDVVTGDRDLFQLVDDAHPVRVLYTARGGVRNLEIMDAGAIRRRYGIDPQQYADFATLRGDPSDGLPGVPGIGEKSAASLLAKHGSLEGLIEAAAANPRGFQAAAKVNAARDYLLRAAPVVRGVRTLDLPPVDTALPREPKDPGKVAELGEKLGIGNVLDRATKALALPAAG